MKIVQFVNNLDMGGLERLAVDLAIQQQAAGHTALIYCLSHRGYFADEAEAQGIRVHAFEKPPGPSPKTLRRIVSAMRKDRPDVLHTHNHLVHHYGVVAGRIAGIRPIVNTRHGASVVLREQPSGYVAGTDSPDPKADLIYRATMPWTDAVVMISESARQFFTKRRGVPAAKACVILNGAPLDPFVQEPASPGAMRPRIRFGSVSRMVAEKDHFTLLAAFAKVATVLPEAELHLAGDGVLFHLIRWRIEELNLTGKVFLYGAVRDVPAFLSGLDVFVTTSIIEGLPISVLEAMAAGLPIVATRAGGLEEAAVEGLNARFAEPGDADGVARHMIDLARSPDLASIGAHGRAIVAERFQIDRTWLEYERLFDRVRGGAAVRGAVAAL